MSEIFNLQTLCRCCHTDGNFKSLQLPYMYKNNVEVYYNMLQEVFEIKMNIFDVSNTICDNCIQQLRDAYCFKKQVLDCEEKFKEYCINEQAVEVKEETYDSDGATGQMDTYYPDNPYGSDNDEDKKPDRETKNEGSDNDENEKPASKTKIECNDNDNEYYVEIENVPAENRISVEFDSKKVQRDSKKTKISTKHTVRKRMRMVRSHPDPELEIRLQTDINPIYICKICGEKCRTRGILKHHILESHREAYKCSYCSEFCENGKSYLAHIKKHSKPTCNVCGLRFSDKKALLQHSIKHMKTDNYQCDLCKKFFAYKQSLKKHLLWHRGEHKKCVCDICGHSFNDNTNLNIHIRCVHLKLRPFKCSHCSKTFTANKHLKEHLRKHTEDKPYHCDVCMKNFAGPANLKTHILRKHTENLDCESLTHTIRHVTCRICNMTFESRGKLRSHRRAHIGQQQYKCHLCPKDFASKYTLNRHINIHKGIKAFACELCNKKFADRGGVNRHKYRRHNPNKRITEKVRCDLCNKHYRNIEKHIDAHNKRPHACDYCNKRYPERNTLNRHIKVVHLNIKPFPCSLCEKKYTKISGLRRHSMKIHKVCLKTEKDN